MNTAQHVTVDVTADGAWFSGSGNNDSRDNFSLSWLQWGREGKLQAVQSSRIYTENNVVYHEYSPVSQAEGLSERFSNDSGTIQHELILPVKPQGSGVLHLQLHVAGATANTRAGGASIVLGSGRHLAMDSLQVTDTAGNKIPAHLMVEKNNLLDIVVEDVRANYPLTIHTVLDEISVVHLPGSATTATALEPQVKKTTNTVYDDDGAHSAVKPPPEIIKAVEELRKPAPGDGEETHHADGSVSIKLGNRFSSIPVATTGADGKVHVDYHGEAYVTNPPAQTPLPSTQPPTETTGDNKP